MANIFNTIREEKMKKLLVIIAGVILFSASPAAALFDNGGFETGDTSGWIVVGDNDVISSFTPKFDNTTGWDSGIPYYDDYSLLLGSPAVGNEYDDKHQSSATQTGTITQDDVNNGLHLFFRWGALLEEPTNLADHTDAEQPYFSIEISSWNGSLWDRIYFEDQRANQSGFSKVGVNESGSAGDIWYGTAIADIDLLGLGLGLDDLVKIELFVKDCGRGGHGGLVFLDGFGTTRPTDPVPEPATLLLLGFGLAGLGGLRIKNKRR
jgi:hypothetical protein